MAKLGIQQLPSSCVERVVLSNESGTTIYTPLRCCPVGVCPVRPSMTMSAVPSSRRGQAPCGRRGTGVWTPDLSSARLVVGVSPSGDGRVWGSVLKLGNLLRSDLMSVVSPGELRKPRGARASVTLVRGQGGGGTLFRLLHARRGRQPALFCCVAVSNGCLPPARS
jgi:hypothetical protein